MMKINWKKNTMPGNFGNAWDEYVNKEKAEDALAFHKTLEGYEPTPLCHLSKLAEYLGVSEVFVKDESRRFDLNAFKVMGASYAMHCYQQSEKGFGSKQRTFYAATDGNHGRAVAWTARRLGQKAVIYMPKGSTKQRLESILATGAEGAITELNYDDTVRFAKAEADKNGGIIIQDTAWEGYEEIPIWIMQGYAAIALEVLQQLSNEELPTHIFLQAGVGSFASSIMGFFHSICKEKTPVMVVVESDQADCYFQSALAEDGKARFVGGDMQTLMAGLACGEPNRVSFELIKNYGTGFLSCDDAVTAYGMRILGNPIQGDPSVISGESGAVTLGAVAQICRNENYKWIKEALKLDKDSRILCFSTEGDTDSERYRKIVWDALEF